MPPWARSGPSSWAVGWLGSMPASWPGRPISEIGRDLVDQPGPVRGLRRLCHPGLDRDRPLGPSVGWAQCPPAGPGGRFPRSGVTWSISPVLFGVCVGYATLGSIGTVLLGRRLAGLNARQLAREADFRDRA